jgi:hypothetical protein
MVTVNFNLFITPNVGGFGPGVEFSNCPPGTAADVFADPSRYTLRKNRLLYAVLLDKRI